MSTYVEIDSFNIFFEDISPADPKVLDGYEIPVLHKYVLSRDFDAEVMQNLINNEKNLDIRNFSGKTALHLAVINRAKDKVEFLLENGANVHAKDYYGNSALHFIALAELNYHFETINSSAESQFLKPTMFKFDDTYSILDRLLKEGVDVNASNKRKDTPLMWASRGRYLEIVKKLLAFGANVYLENIGLETCLHFASNYFINDYMTVIRYDQNYHAILSELVRNKACVNCGECLFLTPLGNILYSGHRNKAKFAEELIKFATLWNWGRKIEFYIITSRLRLGDHVEDRDIKEYADDCYEEIVAMKARILPEGYKLCEFARGEVTEEVLRRVPEIKDEVLRILVGKSFKKYKDLIVDRLGRQFLRQKARDLFIIARGKNPNIYLNLDIIHYISSYLNNIDIFNLLAACMEQLD